MSFRAARHLQAHATRGRTRTQTSQVSGLRSKQGGGAREDSPKIQRPPGIYGKPRGMQSTTPNNFRYIWDNVGRAVSRAEATAHTFSFSREHTHKKQHCFKQKAAKIPRKGGRIKYETRSHNDSSPLAVPCTMVASLVAYLASVFLTVLCRGRRRGT